MAIFGVICLFIGFILGFIMRDVVRWIGSVQGER